MGLIIRAEDFYLPPPNQRPDAWKNVRPAERVIRWYEQRQQRRIPVTSNVVVGPQPYARINHSRWVADCTCGSAQIVSPADPRMWCVECGTGWWTLTFPADIAAVEAEMAALPASERNWWHPDDPTRPQPDPEPEPQPEPDPEPEPPVDPPAEPTPES